MLHESSIVIDAVCPLVMDSPTYLEWYREGGVTTLAPTIGSTECARAALDRLAAWHRLLRDRKDLLLVRKAADVVDAKQAGRTGIYFHIQGGDPIENNLDLVDLYKALGVGMIQLTYNSRTRVGDGCEEISDTGLSRFGRKLVERLNQARVIVDCSHGGRRTALDAVECSSFPVVLSHSNAYSVQASPRNVTADLIGAIAKSGGVIGIAGFPSMVANGPAPSLNQFIAHIDAVVQTVGIDYVGLGMDYYTGQSGVADDQTALREYNDALSSGAWSTAYPPPPHVYPSGIETPRTLSNLTARLSERGYSNVDVKKILGGNWLRIMQTVWG